MDRRDFIKKATMAAAGAAVVSPVSAMLNTVTGKQCKVLMINGSPRPDGNTFCCLKESPHSTGTLPMAQARAR